jgi:TolA-binding protein
MQARSLVNRPERQNRRTGRIVMAIATVLAAALLVCPHADAQQPRKESDADLQFEFAEKLFQIKAYKTAGAEYRRFLKDFPTDKRREDTRYKLAISHFKIGGAKEYKKALGELVTLRKEFPSGKLIQDCLFRSGHVRYLLADAKGAIANLSELQKLKVRSDLIIPMHHFLGRAYYDLGRNDIAVRHLGIVAKAPKTSPLRQFALVVLADAHLKLKRLGDGAAALEALLRDYPKLPSTGEMWLKLADARLLLKEHKKALAAYAKVPAKGASGQRAMLGRARALLGLRQYSQASAAARQLLKAYKETAETKGLRVQEQCEYIIGLAAFSQQQYAPAAQAFVRLLARVRQGAMAEDSAYKLCWSYFRLGPKNAKKLVASCVNFRRLFPRSKWGARIVFITGEGHLWLGDHTNAIANYKQVGPKDANYADALYRIAYCYHRQKNADAAARAYDLFAAKFGKSTQARAAIAGAAALYQAVGKHDLAIDRYKTYLAAKPKGATAEEATYQLGVCYAKRSKFTEMATAFANYVKAYPRGRYAGTVWHWLGRYHRGRGDVLTKKRDTAGAMAAYAQAGKALNASLGHKGIDRDRTLLAIAECRYNLGNKQMDQAAELKTKAQGAKGAEQAKLLARTTALQKGADASLTLAARGFVDLMARKPELHKSEAVYFWTGTFFRTRRDPKSAISVFQAFLTRFAKSKRTAEALFQLVRLHAETKPPDHNGLISYADQLIKLAPTGPRALQAKHAKADALYAKRQLRDAEKLYLEVYQRGAEPLKVASTMRLGHIGFALKEYAAAARYFAQIGLLYNDKDLSPEALYFAGKSNRLLKDYDEVVKFWQPLLQAYGKSKWAVTARKELGAMGYAIDGKNGIQRK